MAVAVKIGDQGGERPYAQENMPEEYTAGIHTPEFLVMSLDADQPR